jgi:capsule biosynthesis phosphatase
LFTENRDYDNSLPNVPVVEGLRKLKDKGWKVILMSARGMGRSNGDIASVSEEVKAEIKKFVEKYNVPCDDIILGKPWASYYIDDKAIRPDEFVEKIDEIVNGEYAPYELWG